jgi:hypothetical protein
MAASRVARIRGLDAALVRTIGRPGPRPGQQHDASHSLAVGGHLVIVGITCRLQQRVWQKGPDEFTEPAGPLAPSPGGLVGAPLVKQDRFRYSPSGEAFWSPALSISAPIFLETFGACPLVCGEGTPGVSVAASGTVAMAGLFGVELWNSGGELVGSDG